MNRFFKWLNKKLTRREMWDDLKEEYERMILEQAAESLQPSWSDVQQKQFLLNLPREGRILH